MKRLGLSLTPVVLAAALVACSSSVAADPPVPSGPVDPDAPVVIAWRNAFWPAEVRVTAGRTLTLRLDNRDAAPHNVAIFTDPAAGTPISIGEIVSSTTADQQVPALEERTYFFRCDVHRSMTGSIVAE